MAETVSRTSAINLPRVNNRFKIRRATLRDLDHLVHQRRGMWEEIGNHDKAELDHADRVYRRWMETRLKNGSLVGWLVEKKDREVAGGGCLWLQPVQPRPRVKRRKLPYLLSMYTEPRFRGNGVATLIVEEAINWCRENGYPRLTLHASEMGRGVYLRLGFERTWEMRLKLSP